MQFTTVRSKEKDYDIYLKSEKLVHSQQEHEKSVSQQFENIKNWFLAISSLTNTVAAIQREKKLDPCYLETKKCSSQLLGERKKIMPSIQSQKNWFSASRSTKKCFPAIWKWKKLVPSYFEPDKTVEAIWREKKVDPCYLETKKCSSQLLGARKKIMTSIKVRKTGSQPVGTRKKCFPAIWKCKKKVPSYFEPDKHCCSYLVREKSVSLLFGDQNI